MRAEVNKKMETCNVRGIDLFEGAATTQMESVLKVFSSDMIDISLKPERQVVLRLTNCVDATANLTKIPNRLVKLNDHTIDSFTTWQFEE